MFLISHISINEISAPIAVFRVAWMYLFRLGGVASKRLRNVGVQASDEDWSNVAGL